MTTHDLETNFEKAALKVLETGKASTSFIQRELSIGYNKAARILERLEDIGLITAANSDGKRNIQERAAVLHHLHLKGIDIASIKGKDGLELIRAANAAVIKDQAITDHVDISLENMEEKARAGRAPMKEDPDFKEHNSTAFQITAEELRQIVECIERLEEEKRNIAQEIKEVYAKGKGRGYDTKIIRKIIALRKRTPEDIANEEATLEMYKEALGMQTT